MGSWRARAKRSQLPFFPGRFPTAAHFGPRRRTRIECRREHVDVALGQRRHLVHHVPYKSRRSCSKLRNETHHEKIIAHADPRRQTLVITQLEGQTHRRHTLRTRQTRDRRLDHEQHRDEINGNEKRRFISGQGPSGTFWMRQRPHGQTRLAPETRRHCTSEITAPKSIVRFLEVRIVEPQIMLRRKTPHGVFQRHRSLVFTTSFAA